MKEFKLLRTFSTPEYPELNNKLISKYKDIVEKRFSRLVSLWVDDIIEYLRRNELNPKASIYFRDGIIVPKIILKFYASRTDVNKVLKFESVINKMGWIVCGIKDEATQSILKSTSELKSYLRSYGYFQMDIKPFSFHATKVDLKLGLVDFARQDTSIYMFHVTDRSNVKSILKHGLEPRSSTKTEYRYAPCVHLLRYLGGKMLKLLGNDLIDNPGLHLIRPVLLKVGPLNYLDLDLFVDPSSPDDGIICPQRIEPRYIQEVPKEDYRIEFSQYDLDKGPKYTRMEI